MSIILVLPKHRLRIQNEHV